MSDVLVFVYGTLRSGEENHALVRSCRFVGAARTLSEFTLLSLGRYPGMRRGGSTAIVGELYEVEPATLAALDRFEDHPRGYRRERVRLEAGTEAEAYLLAAARGTELRVLASGDWCNRS